VTGRNEATVVHDPTRNAVLAKQALVQLGFLAAVVWRQLSGGSCLAAVADAAVADAAVRAASAHVDTDVSLEDFIREALRNCR